MSKTKEKELPKVSEETDSPELEAAERDEMVTFVANNILNSITLNQTVTIIQQVALRDAATIVDEADDKKLEEIAAAMSTAAEQAAAQQSQEGEPSGDVEQDD